jgi:hypothetical protein
LAVLVEETFARARLVRMSRGQTKGAGKMRSNRRRNWLIRRIALGFAVAAFAAPVAQASVDNLGWPGVNPSDYAASTVKASDTLGWPGVNPSDYAASAVKGSAYGMPRPTAMDYAISRGDLIEVVRSTPTATSSDKIEFVRTQPRSITEPQLASRFVRPNTTTGDELASWNVDWQDAGIGAGLALALVLLGGGAALASRHVGRAQTA